MQLFQTSHFDLAISNQTFRSGAAGFIVAGKG